MKRIAEGQATRSPVSHDSSISKSVYLIAGDIPGILQWATSTLDPGASVTPHSHPDATEIFHILEGAMVGNVGDRKLKLEKGSLLVVEPGEIHKFRNDGKVPCSFLYTLLETGHSES